MALSQGIQPRFVLCRTLNGVRTRLTISALCYINRQVRASKMLIPETGREEDALSEELGDAFDVV